MFGVMFGDMGHGSILLTFAIYVLTLKYKITNSKDVNTLISFGYFLLMMGFFAVYCGLIYNDFMSIPLNFFGSCHKADGTKRADCTYTFGVDPAWGIA